MREKKEGGRRNQKGRSGVQFRTCPWYIQMEVSSGRRKSRESWAENTNLRNLRNLGAALKSKQTNKQTNPFLVHLL